MEEANVSKLKRRRGVSKGSLTRLITRVGELERAELTSDTIDSAQHYKDQLTVVDAEFRTHHYAIVDVTEDDETLATEQLALDEHDDSVSQLMTRLQKILRSNAPTTGANTKEIQARQLTHLERAVDSTNAEIVAIPIDLDDTYLLQQYANRIAEYRTDLKTTQGVLLSLGLEETNDLFTIHARLSKKIFECGHKIKKLLGQHKTAPTHESKGVRLPKLEVPTFDGSVLNWTAFWEQFSVSVHSRTNISDAEQLVYLQQALKDGTARVWEAKTDWDEVLPQPNLEEWLQWRSELHLITEKSIGRCYYPKSAHVRSFQLHGFCDASELAYAAVVYLRMVDTDGNTHVSLITSKTKVAPIKRLSLPRLELCGANLLAKLMFHVKEVFNMPLQAIHALTDSTIVLNWLDGNPRRFKTYVGNRVACIMELIPSSHWRHVIGIENPADCASRGLFPSEILEPLVPAKFVFR